jgi:hypothetical protein
LVVVLLSCPRVKVQLEAMFRFAVALAQWARVEMSALALVTVQVHQLAGQFQFSLVNHQMVL